MKKLHFEFKVNEKAKTIHVEREFNGDLDLVWEAWTNSELLDQWWAPKPYKAITRKMDFTPGGHWLYCMKGPEGDVHWSIFNYDKIRPKTYFSGNDSFCDEKGTVNPAMPQIRWEHNFTPAAGQTRVDIKLQLKSLEDLETLIQTGFKEGFTAGMENLDQYIEAQFLLRKQNKTGNRARVASYLNFPGTAEEAFNFYKGVFKTEFVNGIRRFGDLPADTNYPPVAEAVKKMVLHVELPIPGGHVLMATDSPKEMGFTLSKGNNMHISLEPETREEAKRLFDELSAGGEIEMPIQDMPWGAYYGNFRDKFGINWMVNFQPV